MKVNYRQEFFDREYTAKEAYARLWTFARKYKFRLVMGVLCGMLTAGTLAPMFGMIQPALAKVERRDQGSGGDIREITSFVFRLKSFCCRQAVEENPEGIRQAPGVGGEGRRRDAG